MADKITVETVVNVERDEVWELFNNPKDIKKWASASEDWHTTKSSNDLRIGGKFSHRMEAKDGSAGFDFAGTYDEVEKPERIAYTMDDGRKVEITFEDLVGSTRIIETFDPEQENTEEFQKAGWQAILDNFKKYAEGLK
jgi:uncharacterized protein YndB with AHSA1/START domain